MNQLIYYHPGLLCKFESKFFKNHRVFRLISAYMMVYRLPFILQGETRKKIRFVSFFDEKEKLFVEIFSGVANHQVVVTG